MVEIKNLVKRYGSKIAVNNISLNIKKGEIVGFLGPNGAGKSTTMNIITGYIAPTNGTVKVNGLDILKNPIAAKCQIGYLPEQPPLYLDMTVKGYLKFIYNLKKVKLDRTQHINEICEKVGISDVYDRQIKKLSKGYKQRVGIAQALIGYPPLIILDEPTVGLDPKQIISIRSLIKDLAKDHTTIFSSHILYEVQMMCDRIIVINSGKIIADKSTADIVSEGKSAVKSIVVDIEGEIEKVLNLLREIAGVKNVEMTKDLGKDIYEYIVEYEGPETIRKEIFSKLAQNNLCLTKLDTLDLSLEDAFLKIIDKHENENCFCEEELFEDMEGECEEDNCSITEDEEDKENEINKDETYEIENEFEKLEEVDEENNEKSEQEKRRAEIHIVENETDDEI